MKTSREIFEILDKEIAPNDTFVPNKLFELKLPLELWGFFGILIGHAFIKMRETSGESNWEFECSFFKKKERGKSRLTINNIRKYLVKGLEFNIVKNVREENFKIYATINIEYLMQGLGEEK